MSDQPPNDAHRPAQSAGSSPLSHVVRLAELNARRTQQVFLEPDAKVRAAIAQTLGISAIRKLRFAGHLSPQGRTDWRLEATLGATVVQPCIVTLDPVTTRIDEPVLRQYLAVLNDGEVLPEQDGEFEMPEDDTQEPLPTSVDLGAVMLEALALALPLWPRVVGAETGEVILTEPGKAAMRDEDARPFANLRDQLAAKRDGGADSD